MRIFTSDTIGGDIEVFASANDSPSGEKVTLFQVDGIDFKPFTLPSAADGHLMFSKWTWGPLTPDNLLDDRGDWEGENDKSAIPIMERIVFFYIRTFLQQLTQDDRQYVAPYHQQQIEWFEHILEETRNGLLHEWYDACWEADTRAETKLMCDK